ncbi:hypothetical protein C0J52_23960 [Blattella germanica]|nr:hypothetical protein C0J52_23960 [Blattella germanica]
MRARDLVFHVHCFTCAVCNTTLSKGDHFGMKDSTVLCRIHYELSLSEQTHSPVNPSPASFPGGGGPASYPPPFPSPEFHHHHHHASPMSIPPVTTACAESGNTKVPYFNGSTTGTTRQKGRPRKRKPKDLEAMTASLGEAPISKVNAFAQWSHYCDELGDRMDIERRSMTDDEKAVKRCGRA